MNISGFQGFLRLINNGSIVFVHVVYIVWSFANPRYYFLHFTKPEIKNKPTQHVCHLLIQ